MTTIKKLSLSFGGLTLLLALSVAAIFLRLQSIERNLREQAEVARPRYAATRELETSIEGYTLAIRTYFQTGDVQFRQAAMDEVAAIARHLADYEKFATTSQQQELAARFAQQWQQYNTSGQALLDSPNRSLSQAASQRLTDLRLALRTFLKNELQQEAVRTFDARRAVTVRDIQASKRFALALLTAGVLLAILTGLLVGRGILKSEQVLEESREWLRVTLASIGDAILATDCNGRVTFLNPVAATLTGWTAEEAVGKPAHEVFRIINETTRATVESPLEKALRDGRVVGLANHTLLLARDGREIPLDDSAAPVRDELGTVRGVVLVFRDVTERKQTEEQLIAQQRLYQSVTDNASVALFIMDDKQQCVFMNPAAEQLTGYTQPQASGRALHDVVHHQRPDGSPYPLSECPIDQAFPEQNKMQGEEVFVHKDGHFYDVAYTASPLRDGRGTPVGTIIEVQDITERKRAEEALRNSEARLSAILQNTKAVVYLMDNESRFIHINRQFEELFDLQVDLIRGKSVYDVFPQEFAELFATNNRRVLAAGRALELEENAPQRDGVHTYLSIKVPQLDAAGKATGIVGISTDITERKQAEAEREELLAREQKARAAAESATRAKDEFLSLVTHELRNPLNSILGYTRLTRMKPHDAAQVVRHCEIIERSARMQQQLIDDLLDTARIISGKMKLETALTDLRLVVEDALLVVRPAAEAKQIDLVTHFPDEVPPIMGDAARLQQIAWNLLQNAIKFTPQGGRVELCLERAVQHARLTISDTGKGIAPEFLPFVFDRFSQNDSSHTRRHGGLGLGLALVQQLVELHGGTIVAASAGENRGATFTVEFPFQGPQLVASVQSVPAIADINNGPEALALAPLPRLDGVRVLLVDDMEEARLFLGKALRSCGAVVTTAASGYEAEEYLEQGTFDVMVCDIAMPGRDGYEVLRRLRAREHARGLAPSQQLAAIALTALTRRDDRWQALNAGFQMHVAKPVQLAELVLVINMLIEIRQDATSE